MTDRICNRCQRPELESPFTDKGRHCKECVREYNADYYKRHAEQRKEYSNNWAVENHDRVKERSKSYYWNNRDKVLQKGSEWKAANREAVKEYSRKWSEENREASREKARRWGKENPDKVNARTSRRRCAKLQRTISLKQHHVEQMKAVYAEAKRLSKATGIPHHVDHVVPLQGVYVSGLHVPWNLQVITAEENLSKKNHFVPDLVSSGLELMQ